MRKRAAFWRHRWWKLSWYTEYWHEKEWARSENEHREIGFLISLLSFSRWASTVYFILDDFQSRERAKSCPIENKTTFNSSTVTGFRYPNDKAGLHCSSLENPRYVQAVISQGSQRLSFSGTACMKSQYHASLPRGGAWLVCTTLPNLSSALRLTRLQIISRWALWSSRPKFKLQKPVACLSLVVEF